VVLFGFSFCFGFSYISVQDTKFVTERTFKGELVVKDINKNSEVSKVILYSKDLDQNILLNIFPYQNTNLLPGDVISVSGKLENDVVIYPQREKGEWDSFDYSLYLKSKDIAYVLKADSIDKSVTHETNVNRVSHRIRSNLFERLKSIMPDENAGVLLAMVLGDDRGLTKEIKDSFRDSGLSHVLVFSGFNFSVLISAFSILLLSFSKKGKLTMSFLAAGLILLLAPLSAPTARAGVFVFYSLLCEMFNKSYNVKFVFYLFIFAYTLFDPLSAVSNASFHLSVLAVAAIIYGEEIVNLISEKALKRYFLMILSIFLVTSPYIAYMFGNVSLFSLLANAMALPIVSVITIFGVIVILISLLSLTLASVFAHVLNYLINTLVKIAEIFSPYALNIKGAELDLSFIVFYYCILVIIYNFLTFHLKNNKHKSINQ
jgi:competence protein ComEC